MGTTVDSLEIQLQAQATKANTAIDTLISKLGTLNTSLTKINGSGLSGVANGVDKLSRSMQGLKNVGTADYTRLAKGIEKIANLDSGQISKAANAIVGFGKGLQSLNSVNVSKTSEQVADLAKGISQLGYKSSTKAIENIPLLATAMKKLMSELSKAPKVSQNLIDMTNALAKLARTGASSGRAANALSGSLNTYTKSAHKASRGTKGLASALGKMYATYWLLFRFVGKIGDSITIASDLVEVQNVVDTVFGDMSSKVEEYAQNSIKQFGMSELSFKQYASRFQAMGSAMGIDTSSIENANSFLNKATGGYVGLSDSMADVSLNLTQLTADMASFYNVSQKDVAKDLEAIFTGETRPLRTYGLDLTQATLAEWAMKNGLDANVQSMSQAEKTMLRYQYVIANTTSAQGDFARTAGTWANQIRILQEQIKKFASIIGTGFIAAFKPFVQTLNMVMAKVIDFTQNVLNALGQIFGWEFEISGGGITDDLGDVSGDLADSAGSSGDLSDNLGQAAKNAKKLHTLVIDEFNILQPEDSSSDSGSGGSGSGTGSAGIGNAGLSTSMKRNDAMIEAYKSSIKNLEQLGDYIGDTLTNAMNRINWTKVYNGARNFGTGLADFLNGLISPALFGATGRTIANSLNTAIYTALSFGETFDFYDFGVSIATGINEFFRNFDFRSLAESVNVWLNGFEDFLIGAISNISWGNIINSIYKFISSLEIDSAILIGWVTLPKLLKKVTSSKIITGFVILTKALRGNKDSIVVLTKNYPKLGKAVDVARKAFSRFRFGIENGNVMTGLNESILTVRNSLTKMQKGAIGAASVFANFSLAKSGFEEIISGSGNVVSSLAKIASGAGIAATALKFIGVSTPLTAVITGVTTLTSAAIGMKKSFEDQKEMDIFGGKLSDITSKINESSEAIRIRASASKEYIESAGIAEVNMASDLASKYFDLSEKENLTNEEKDKMKNLAKALVETIPELEQYYNSQTGLLETTRESIKQLIDTRLKEIKLSAVEEQLKDAYEQQAEQLKNVEAAIKPANKAQEEMNKLKENYQMLMDKQEDLDKFNQLSEKIQSTTGDTSKLQEEQKKLWDEITNKGKNNEYGNYDNLTLKIQEAKSEIDGFKKKYEEAWSTLSDARETYSDVENNITELTNMLTNGMIDAAENSAAGYSETFAKDTTMKDSVISQADDLLAAKDKCLGINSPSKKFEESAKYCIEGYVLGINKNGNTAVESVRMLANMVISAFNDGISMTGDTANKMPIPFKSAFEKIKNIFSPSTQEFFDATFVSAYEKVKKSFLPIDSYFYEKWNSTKLVFKDTKSFFKNAFENAYQAIKTAFKGTRTFFNGIANDILNPIEGAVNGVAKGMNWILKEVGSGQRIGLWSAPRFATGSDGLPSNTIGVVNDQAGSTYKELIVPPHGKPFIPEGRNVMLPMEKGTKIMPAGQTKALMSGMPRFKNGIGDLFGEFWKNSSDYTGDVMDYIAKPKEIVQIAIDKFTNTSGWSGIYKEMAKGAISTVLNSAVDFIKKVFDSTGSASVEKAIRWAIGIANDNSHGYDQANRWGNPDYDCSSLVISAFEKAGIKMKSAGATYTGNMYNIAKSLGFADVTSGVNLGNGSGLKRGDILLNRRNHTAMYIGNGKVVQASSNEKGGIRGGVPGDQTGREINVSSYYNYPWNDVLRFVKRYKDGIGRISIADLIPQYSVGGFPEDGLFMVNRNELVGQFSDGRTAVANDFQIVGGIKQGVKEAVAEILAPYLSDIAQNTRETADKDLTVRIQDRDIVTSYDRGKRRNGYSFT